MKAISIREALAGNIAAGTAVTVQGWVRTRRDSKAGLSFIQLNDGSCFDNIQLVAPGELENYQSEVLRLTAGCAIIARGALVESKGRGQAWEIQAESIEVIGWVDDPDTYPIQQKKHTFEYLREMAHLRPRTNTFGAVTRVRHQVSMAVHRYFHDNDYYWIHTPIVTAADAEGAGELFRVSTLDLLNLPRSKEGNIDFTQDFFDKETFLTVSGQLNVECYCEALTRVYTFGPTFRAENSNTSRHLAEFWMIEPEIAFADLNDLADLAEDFLKYIAADVLEHRGDDMRFFQERIEPDCIKRLEHLIQSSFERMEYSEAVEILTRSGQKFEFPVEWGRDLQTEHERYLSEDHVGKPVIVLNYPKDIKAFYMRLNDDGKTVAALDVLAPGIGEIIGGSQREERLDYLDRRLDEMDTKESLWWYRDLRRYGTVPHAGFGLGFDRLINYITGMANIRDVIPFPRTPGSAPF